MLEILLSRRICVGDHVNPEVFRVLLDGPADRANPGPFLLQVSHSAAVKSDERDIDEWRLERT